MRSIESEKELTKLEEEIWYRRRRIGPELVISGDTYCIKHRELLTPGLELDEDGNQLKTCGFCEWRDE